ncbi:Fumarate and nitrate reduction regulatory protein [Arsenophonus endosymbiont of Bemisia tabaci Q2]|nr:Fumarate and nitrate reduction regulatory protein [Arsenophonus endosymbiont of Bemisia tabaci Q2]
MIPEKNVVLRIQSGGCASHCQDCSISQLCIPFTFNEHELDQLDSIIERKKLIQKGQTLFKAGDELKSLYAIKSATIKSYTITDEADEQITGFHLAGDLVGFDAIINHKHLSFSQTIETSIVCRITFETLDDLSGKMSNLRQQIMRLMSSEIKDNQEMILLLSQKKC